MFSCGCCDKRKSKVKNFLCGNICDKCLEIIQSRINDDTLFNNRLSDLSEIQEMLMVDDLYFAFSNAVHNKYMMLDENAEPFTPDIFLSDKVETYVDENGFCITYYYKTPKFDDKTFVKGDYVLWFSYRKGAKSILVTDKYPNFDKNGKKKPDGLYRDYIITEEGYRDSTVERTRSICKTPYVKIVAGNKDASYVVHKTTGEVLYTENSEGFIFKVAKRTDWKLERLLEWDYKAQRRIERNGLLLFNVASQYGISTAQGGDLYKQYNLTGTDYKKSTQLRYAVRETLDGKVIPTEPITIADIIPISAAELKKYDVKAELVKVFTEACLKHYGEKYKTAESTLTKTTCAICGIDSFDAGLSDTYFNGNVCDRCITEVMTKGKDMYTHPFFEYDWMSRLLYSAKIFKVEAHLVNAFSDILDEFDVRIVDVYRLEHKDEITLNCSSKVQGKRGSYIKIKLDFGLVTVRKSFELTKDEDKQLLVTFYGSKERGHHGVTIDCSNEEV